MRIGIDFGGVLTDTTSPPDTDFLSVPPRAGSREVIEEWSQRGHSALLVSKAGDSDKEEKAKLWLAHYKLDEIFEDMEFCRTQVGKVEICERKKIKVMVDDTEPQLRMLRGVVSHLILFNATRAPGGMTPAMNWRETSQIVSALQR